MRLRAVPSTLCAIALAGSMIAGCGGSSGNGVEAKSADQIVAAARSAAEGAHSVTVSGVARSSGVSLKIDLQIEEGKGAKGKISENGLAVQLIRVGDGLYIKAGAPLYRHFGAGEAAKLLEGRWVKASATNGQLASLGSLTELHALLGSVLGEHRALKKGSTSTVGGQKVIAVSNATGGGTLYVAVTGKPYPVQLSRTGSEGGKVTFGNWDEPVSVSAPSKAIDISKLP